MSSDESDSRDDDIDLASRIVLLNLDVRPPSNPPVSLLLRQLHNLLLQRLRNLLLRRLHNLLLQEMVILQDQPICVNAQILVLAAIQILIQVSFGIFISGQRLKRSANKNLLLWHPSWCNNM